jgi:hypothetical protein
MPFWGEGERFPHVLALSFAFDTAVGAVIVESNFPRGQKYTENSITWTKLQSY